MKRICTIVLVASMGLPGAAQEAAGFKPVFNGKDLDGWDTWLGKPHKLIDVPGHPRNEKGDYLGTVGLNTDPKEVYRVVEADGQPALRISGEVWGAITTREEFENYHLRFEFKWGKTKWPPRDKLARDSGCLYHCVGPYDAGSGFWMKSFEIQVQEKDCGDFHSVAGVMVDVEAVPRDPNNSKSDLVYRKGAPKVVGHMKRILKGSDHEKPTGEWNTLEVIAVGQTSVHIVNGSVNMLLTGLRHKVEGKEVPLTRGRIQFQSEGAEVFYRNIRIRPLAEIPREYLQ